MICGMYTVHAAVFCGLCLLSSDISKNISFDTGFIGNCIKGNLASMKFAPLRKNICQRKGVRWIVIVFWYFLCSSERTLTCFKSLGCFELDVFPSNYPLEVFRLGDQVKNIFRFRSPSRSLVLNFESVGDF